MIGSSSPQTNRSYWTNNSMLTFSLLLEALDFQHTQSLNATKADQGFLSSPETESSSQA